MLKLSFCDLTLFKRQTTIVRTAGQGSVVLQANGALIVRKLRDSVHELIMPPAALIAYDNSCKYVLQNKFALRVTHFFVLPVITQLKI